jgi:hypothetical protein
LNPGFAFSERVLCQSDLRRSHERTGQNENEGACAQRRVEAPGNIRDAPKGVAENNRSGAGLSKSNGASRTDRIDQSNRPPCGAGG